jgi:hypothetical protein
MAFGILRVGLRHEIRSLSGIGQIAQLVERIGQKQRGHDAEFLLGGHLGQCVHRLLGRTPLEGQRRAKDARVVA